MANSDDMKLPTEIDPEQLERMRQSLIQSGEALRRAGQQLKDNLEKSGWGLANVMGIDLWQGTTIDTTAQSVDDDATSRRDGEAGV